MDRVFAHCALCHRYTRHQGSRSSNWISTYNIERANFSLVSTDAGLYDW